MSYFESAESLKRAIDKYEGRYSIIYLLKGETYGWDVVSFETILSIIDEPENKPFPKIQIILSNHL